MVKLLSVIGARPQFVKAAAVSAAVLEHPGVEEIIVHTGQHYDPEMSEVFFSELGIPREKYNLAVGSGSHGLQTARMLEGIERLIQEEKPDRVLVYGDTNSTLAAAIAAAKECVPVGHVEAGMRSFNRAMPEEINRVLTDHVADMNFCSNEVAAANLAAEGRGGTAILVGDVMYDCVLKFSKFAVAAALPPELAPLAARGGHVVVTCHRQENTNNPVRLAGIVEAVNRIADTRPVVYPAHPRIHYWLERFGLRLDAKVQVVKPLGYFAMLALLKTAGTLLTDSGGMQKEAFFLGVPCVTMRDETEWTDTVALDWNRLAGADCAAIIAAVEGFAAAPPTPSKANPYGDGDAAGKIVAECANPSSRSGIAANKK